MSGYDEMKIEGEERIIVVVLWRTLGCEKGQKKRKNECMNKKIILFFKL